MDKPYFYILKHIPSQRYYAGSKLANPNHLNLMTESGYQTTSKVVKNMIQKEGLSSFSIVKIKLFDDPDKAYDYETRFLRKVKAKANPLFINQHENTPGFINKGGYALTEKTKAKMSKPKSPETKKKMSDGLRERPKSVYEKSIATRRANGKEWHDETSKAKLSLANQEHWDDETCKEHSTMMKEYYEKNPVGEDTREKVRKRVTGKGNPMHGKTHKEETRRKMREAWARRKANNKEDI